MTTPQDSDASSPEEIGLPGDLDILRSIVEGTAAATGAAFFGSLARHLAAATRARYAFVAEFLPPGRARTLGFWTVDRVADNVEWELRGTPCEEVVRGEVRHYPRGVKDLLPEDHPLVGLSLESYLGVPLRSEAGETLGHLAIFDPRRMPNERGRAAAFQVAAARATAEIERLRTEREILESERRFRDLYEEAPIAYIYEDLESRFVRANRAACTLLGIPPADVVGTVGRTLLAPTEENTRRIEDALTAMKAEGTEFSGIELELRRKDDGRPIWVRWWSKPEPDGVHTRTMLVDITDRVLMAREKARLEQQNVYFQEEIQATHNFEEIVGRSPVLTQVLDEVSRVAPTDATVLLTGETGTGKELIARAIHSRSRRKDKPLIKVNCAALPSGLVESELFGHERGAFSGAIARRIGRFELATGGTIFLDEVGEIPLDVQAKLLRVLQEKEFERVGGSAPIRADARVIAATNRDLRRAVADGSFREDLLYRLDVFPIRVPPLRERANDIPLLARYIVERFAAQVGKKIDTISAETLKRLAAYPWPGNVRELSNILERAVVLANGPVLDVAPALLPVAAPPDVSPRAENGVMNLVDVERRHIVSVLERARWVIEGDGGAAKALGMHPNTLRSRMNKLGIRRPRA